MKSFRIRILAVALAALSSAGAFAADPIAYQSAAFVDYSVSGEPGGYFLDSTQSIGAAFQITQATDVTSIGGYFSQYSADSIFGAIVPLASLASMPSGGVDSNALAHVVFTPTGTDQLVSMNVHLDPGFYGVVFGSGLWGATGTSALVSGQDGANSQLFSGTGTGWNTFAAPDVSLEVDGTVTPVPEPSESALMVGGLATLGLVMRRHRAAR